MRTLCAGIFAVFMAAPSFADDYSTHRGVTLFTQEPCTAVLKLMDENPDVHLEGIEGVATSLAAIGMAWGFILGYDTARGGLHEGESTTLMRLREQCAASPERTAIDILESF